MGVAAAWLWCKLVGVALLLGVATVKPLLAEVLCLSYMRRRSVVAAASVETASAKSWLRARALRRRAALLSCDPLLAPLEPYLSEAQLRPPQAGTAASAVPPPQLSTLASHYGARQAA